MEEQKTKEALEHVQRKHKLIKWEVERERARMLQRLDSSRAVGQWSGAYDNSSFGSCSSSLAFEMAQVANEAASESSWAALAKEQERDWWSVGLEGDVEKLEVQDRRPKGRWAMKKVKKPKEVEMEMDDEVLQEVSVEIKESEEKSDTCRIRQNARLCS